jgi:hypothetical protein
MALSRRKFLKAGTLVALSAAAPLGLTGVAFGKQVSGPSYSPAGFPLPKGSTPNPVFSFRKSTFSSYLNTVFQLRGDGPDVINAKLIRIADAGPDEGRQADHASGKECFSLAFRASGNQPLRQRTYIVEHSVLGTFPLFLTHSSGRAGGHHYEAIINHRRP